MPNLAAAHDRLTGLPRQLLLHDRLAQALAQGRRQNALLALIHIDLDGLERGDGTLGEGGRDRVFQEVAARLRRLVRASDTIARVDGDGFVLILPDLSAQHAASMVASKVVAAVEDGIAIDGHMLRPRASLGIVLFPAHGDHPAELLQRAAAAAAHAKEADLRIHRFAAAPADLRERRLDLTHQLAQAIEQDQLRLEYQPQIDLKRQRPVGLEALLRWRHPALGDVDPQTFVEVAEASGLIGRIGKWALAEACSAAAGWSTAGLGPIRVAVNLSTAQMVGDDLVRVVERALAPSRLPAVQLELELTERSVLGERGSERVLTMLTRLRAMGVRLALDDFGMGHASLRHLGCFPLDALKIDRSFVANLASIPGYAIVECVVELAHRMGLLVTAEGVEHQAQLNTLRELGCDQVQGHILGKPLAAGDVVSWLFAHAKGRT